MDENVAAHGPEVEKTFHGGGVDYAHELGVFEEIERLCDLSNGSIRGGALIEPRRI